MNTTCIIVVTQVTNMIFILRSDSTMLSDEQLRLVFRRKISLSLEAFNT